MKLKNIAIIATAALMMTGCSEDSFLDNKPQGVLSDEVIQKGGQVDLLTTAAYAALMGPSPQDWSVWTAPVTNWSYGSVRSDDAYKGGGGTGDISEIHRMEIMDVDATNGNVDVKWYHLYVSVQRCNAALRMLNSLTDAELADRNVQIAEMKVLRAHFYFELSRLYNKIVYFEENYEGSIQQLSNNEFTRDQILEKIATDLENAEKVLPAQQPEIGRINKYQAAAYAAKVNLYRAYKQDETTHKVVSVDAGLLGKVISYCDEVINSGRYALLDNFQDLDKVSTGDNSKEGVFQVQYSMNDGSGSAGRVNWSNLLNAPQGPYSGDGFFLPSQDLVDAYQTDANGLPEFDTYFTHHFDVWNAATGKSENVSNNVDPRLDYVVGRPGVRWKTYTKTPCQPTWVRDQGSYGQHCSKRFFVSPESSEMFNGWPWGASALNWNIIRYSDVLLWKAEALIESNQNLEEARSLINQIRQRAANSQYWVKDFNDNTKYAANYKIALYPAAGWTQDYARKALRYEFRLETAMEGERFFDLVRWGIAGQTMNAYFAHEKSKRVYYSNSKFTEGKDEYLPISVTQYNLSQGAYTQNPGYASFE
ncbi:RagB/SusD family nutrient uptake outer membrane protein [Prevotella sp. kh1p2]|uniref:RagB/SusD family nutrient uptake outer membrane protein n=1 Tax=Prevotella sp. kh1p2 TaxID=1761883 RepID=UPI0008AFB7E2|nr:RagB/SusD family nutrient uptake outer membrane protein [Prevotella sp. kh1p2]SES70583.1 Starch-binding associating with outer membrane [Prevotella sp. kh1p2]SNU10374.1 Starch-binding associating with outer membrane [Prevotellaceae bacterium KH2P17]